MNDKRLIFKTDKELIYIALSLNSDEPHNTHVGLVYVADGEWYQFHLCWHHRLLETKPNGICLLVSLNIPIERQRFFSKYCRWILEKNREIKYGLKYPDKAELLFESGKIIDYGNGLNCSHFIIFILAKYGLEIVHPLTWPLREKDAEWHRQLVRWMAEKHPGHAEDMKADIGCQRVRPEELAGACLYDNFPVDYNQASVGAKWVLEYSAFPNNASHFI